MSEASEVQAGQGLSYSHAAWGERYFEEVDEVRAINAGIALSLSEENEVRVAVSFCNPLDRFTKERAYQLMKSRLAAPTDQTIVLKIKWGGPRDKFQKRLASPITMAFRAAAVEEAALTDEALPCQVGPDRPHRPGDFHKRFLVRFLMSVAQVTEECESAAEITYPKVGKVVVKKVPAKGKGKKKDEEE